MVTSVVGCRIIGLSLFGKNFMLCEGSDTIKIPNKKIEYAIIDTYLVS